MEFSGLLPKRKSANRIQRKRSKFPEIKKELAAAKVYAEGRGVRIDVTREEMLQNVRLLIDSKLNH